MERLEGMGHVHKNLLYTKRDMFERFIPGIEGLFFTPKLSVGRLWLFEVVGLIPTDEERTKSAEGKRSLGYVHVYD